MCVRFISPALTAAKSPTDNTYVSLCYKVLLGKKLVPSPGELPVALPTRCFQQIHKGQSRSTDQKRQQNKPSFYAPDSGIANLEFNLKEIWATLI
ncbi:MAG: hypothetical protein HOM14_01560 [Gammaproteobacteria bacterium]|jgi:hypothetical protein|nr:hypothetical protein [Gammaproteobacteria bacterium]MBT4076530.1 hypothetical protein [Gammaproteobacteria bacterium]MBT4193480.1 hypothetical protein [Gammaproteobacteria bacterium]MBT4449217.1 hypothetical protein [Gammaproteobacteria bacterium]MBT4859461.1 hypothetical protein [Gammaproteobacteria bacterium]